MTSPPAGPDRPDTGRPELVHPASFAQRQLWVVEQVEAGEPVHHIGFSMPAPASFGAGARLDAALLRGAVDAVVGRQESLRTTFEIRDGELHQLVWPRAAIPVVETDLRDLPAADADAAYDRLCAEDATAPFDLAAGPLMRVRLVHRAERDWLVVVLHHVIADAQSCALLLDELINGYRACAAGTGPAFAPLPVQYADYTAWQTGAVTGPDFAPHVDWWRECLAGLPTVTLPTDRPYPPVPSARGGEVGFVLDGALRTRLADLGREHRATLFMVLLAGWNALLHRYTGEDDLVVGCPVNARSLPELQDVIGLFVNRLVLRNDVSGNPAFADLLDAVRDRTLAAMEHQDVPFGLLVTELQPERLPGRTPLFQVGFNLFPAVRGGGGQYGNGYVRHDLNLDVSDRGDQLDCRLEYREDLFDAATAERMARHLRALLAAVADRPDLRVGVLPMLTEDERAALLGGTPPDPGSEPEPCRLAHHAVERHAVERPDATALADGRGALTYRQLNDRANRLAGLLLEQRAPLTDRLTDTVVGVVARRCAATVVAMIAAHKAGAAYLPLDPGDPPERRAGLLAEAGATLVVDPAGPGDPPADVPAGVTRVPVPAGDEPCPDPDLPVSPAQRAYVLYTSGSTGRPKGVGVEHRQLSAYTAAVIARVGLTDGSYLLAQPFTFDSSGTMTYAALTLGGRLVVASGDEARDPARLAALVSTHGVDYLKITPSHLAALRAGPRPAAVLPRTALIVGGEATPAEWVAGLLDAGCAVYAHYGPTEATIGVTCGRLDAAALDGLASAPLGDPLTGARVYVLDRYGEPVPPGVRGEAYLGGDLVARGYLGAGQTAERFVPDPFAGRPGARMYATGDYCRRRADGRLEFLGRVDQQVKVRGLRVEPGEIEAALLAHPGVAEAAVVAVGADVGSDPRSGAAATRLVGYVRPAHGAAPDEDALRRHARELLPEHMVPARVCVLAALPRTASGKLDRAALPAPDTTAEESAETEWTDAERTLAAVWREVLGVDRVGVHDNFFALGGESIAGIRVVAMARQHGLVLTARQLFQHQTIAGLAAVAESAPAEDGLPAAAPGPAPMTPAQAAFLRTEPEPDRFSQALFVPLARDLDRGHLAAALGDLVAAHEALRLRCTRRPDGWRAELVATGPAVGLRALDDASEAALERAASALEAELDLAGGRLLAAALAGAGSQATLVLVAHHLSVDAVSWRTLLADLELAYTQRERGQDVRLPPATGVATWAAHLAALAGDPDPGEVRYWRDQPDWPLLPERGGGTGGSPSRASVSIEADDAGVLARALPAAGASVAEAVLAAVASACADELGVDRVAVEMEGHGRSDPAGRADLSRTVGWLTSTFPLVLDLPPGGDPSASLRAVKERLRGVPHEGIGHGLLTELASGEDAARLRARPRPQVRFNFLGQLDRLLGGLALFGPQAPRLRARQRGRGLVDVDATAGDGLHVGFAYDPGRVDSALVESVAARSGELLRELAAQARAGRLVAYTPSDFPDAGLDQTGLDDLVRELGLEGADR